MTREVSPVRVRYRRLALVPVAITVLAVATVAAAPAGAQPLDPSGGLRFDFGCTASPVADGYLQVAESMTYDPTRGYGLDRVTSCRDRGTPDPLLRDFTNGASYAFVVDVPNGDYHVTIHSGDAIASNRTNLVVEGVSLGQIFSASGQFGTAAAVVTVADGQLTVDASRDGRLNGIEIVPVTPPSGLRVVGTTLVPDPSVELAWDPVSGSTGYVVYRGESVDSLTRIGDTSQPSFVDETVDLGFTYTYAVTSIIESGVESARSQPTTVTVRDASREPPATPAGFALDQTTTESVTLRWQGVPDALAYYVQRATTPEGPFDTVATASSTQYVDEVRPNRNFFYRIFAVGLGGLSEPSTVVASPITYRPPLQMERIDRGLVAVPTDDGVLVTWRMLGTDPSDVAFRLYRDGTPVASDQQVTNYLDPDGGPDSTYQVAAVIDGREGDLSGSVRPWAEGYLDIPLQRPAGGVTPVGEQYEYNANDASTADLDGDGDYDLVLKWDPSNSKDNSQAGYTGPAILDGLTMDGTLLWRINLGRNIRAGAHYTQFLVYDLDGDGGAEVVAKTADGTTDGQGSVIGDGNADHRNGDGMVLAGPEFLTVFDGLTGAALTTIDYTPPRGNVSDWGDNFGNRVDRFLAGVAYLDGEQPSFVMARGYYTRTVLAAYDWRNGELSQRWVFDSDAAGGQYEGQGNHQLSVADVDHDGRDEIIYGALTIDDDGSALYSTNLGHGDALHVSDLDPAHAGLEVFAVHETNTAACGYEMHAAATGEILWCEFTGRDTGRGTAGDIDPRHAGAEAWAVDGEFNSPTGGLHTADGELISTTIPAANHMIWWDGDLLREVLDHDWVEPRGVGYIGKWDWVDQQTERLLTATGTLSNNGTKGNPSLQADLLGDWREEVLWRTEDSSALRLYATGYPTEHRFPTLMHDPVYRLGVAWQNIGYNQPPHPSYFLGDGMGQPQQPHVRTGSALGASIGLAPPVWGAGDGDLLAVITLPTGYDATDVSVATIRLLADGELVAVKAVRSAANARLLVTFGADQLSGRLVGYSGTVELSLYGHFTDGRSFSGTDTLALR
jgi:fibronectin type 3 domain-containing protein